ncbi:MAG: glutamine amidotransferase-related protein [Rhizobiaceae bacterium]
MKKRIVLIRHGNDAPDDRAYVYALCSGFEPTVRKPFVGEVLGMVDETVAGTVVYGGPFEAYDHGRFPFLKEEARWIEACMARGVPLLGICQGAQQIADVLGASVGPVEGGHGEFGYYRIEPTEAGHEILPGPIHVVQAHFHTFGIPGGATHLASSAAFPNQAFSYGAKTYAFQFHPEVTIEGFRRAQASLGAFYDIPGAQTREEQDRLMYRHDAAQATWFYGFLERLFGCEADASAGRGRFIRAGHFPLALPPA